MFWRRFAVRRAPVFRFVSTGLMASLLVCTQAGGQGSQNNTKSRGGQSSQSTQSSQNTQGQQTSSSTTTYSHPRPVPAQQNATKAGNHPADTNRGQPVGGISGAEEGAIIGGAAAVAVTTILLVHHHEHKLPNPDDLSSNGPQVPKNFDMNHFVVDGYLGPNWPVALDFVLNGPGAVKLDITTAAGVHYAEVLTNGLNGRGISIVYPENLPDRVQAASFDVEAVPPAGSDEPAPRLRVYGMGAGPKAVGSIAIDEVTFGPSAIQMPDPAQFGFHSHSDFSNVRADFILTAAKGDHIIMKQESEDPYGPVAQGVHAQGTWDSKPGTKRNAGQHMLQVRAWRGYGSDWVVAWSPDLVVVNK